MDRTRYGLIGLQGLCGFWNTPCRRCGPEYRVAAVLNPKDLSEAVIDAVLAGRVPTYPALTADNYWEPEMAAKYFLQVGQEEPPTK